MELDLNLNPDFNLIKFGFQVRGIYFDLKQIRNIFRVQVLGLGLDLN
jgi:hypothetical protein